MDGRASKLRLLRPRFAVCRFDPGLPIPAPLDRSPLWSLTHTETELSLVCTEEGIPEGAQAERGWRCLMVEGPIEFTEVGVLAALTVPLALAGVSVFALSTHDTDYLLVKADQLELAQSALRGAGHAVAD
jgi:hypothetical protein